MRNISRVLIPTFLFLASTTFAALNNEPPSFADLFAKSSLPTLRASAVAKVHGRGGKAATANIFDKLFSETKFGKDKGGPAQVISLTGPAGTGVNFIPAIVAHTLVGTDFLQIDLNEDEEGRPEKIRKYLSVPDRLRVVILEQIPSRISNVGVKGFLELMTDGTIDDKGGKLDFRNAIVFFSFSEPLNKETMKQEQGDVLTRMLQPTLIELPALDRATMVQLIYKNLRDLFDRSDLHPVKVAIDPSIFLKIDWKNPNIAKQNGRFAFDYARALEKSSVSAKESTNVVLANVKGETMFLTDDFKDVFTKAWPEARLAERAFSNLLDELANDPDDTRFDQMWAKLQGLKTFDGNTLRGMTKELKDSRK